MAYPWSANDILTAADLNAAIGTGIVSTGLGAWTSFTPTLTQSVTVTKTVTYARYIKIGRLCAFYLNLAVTGSGTASNVVVIGLPLTAGQTDSMIIGSGFILDTSVSTLYTGTCSTASTTTFTMFPNSTDGNTNSLGARVFTAGLASGDSVRAFGIYETAS